MSAWQRLLLGFSIGGLLTLFVHPFSRALLLHPLRGDQIEGRVRTHPLTNDARQIPVPGDPAQMTDDEVYLTGHLIAMKAGREPAAPIPEDHYEVAMRFLRQAEARDRDNAYWPQLIAGLAVRADRPEAAVEVWARAARLSRWESGADRISRDLWEGIEAEEGIRLAWQGLLALRNRPEDASRLIARVPEALLAFPDADDADDETAARALSILNAGLMRDGADSLRTGRRASEMALRAAGLPLSSVIKERHAELERERSQFEQKVAAELGDGVSGRVHSELRRSIDWLVLLGDEEEIYRRRQALAAQTALTASVPSALLFAGAMLGGLALAGLLLQAAFGDIPHPDARLLFASGLALAALLLLAAWPWMLAVWSVILGGLLAVPLERARPGPVAWGLLTRGALAMIALVGLFLLCSWVFYSAASAQVLEPGTSPGERPAAAPERWAHLALFALSLAVPLAAAWARMKRRPILLVVGSAFARVGSLGAIAALAACVIAAPICLYLDVSARAEVESWIMNEPQAFKTDQP
ncbi:MAG: hypothetical protein IH851_00355 [Armatimonadetes bacterium]|nr:hypothetical protein [Armatimonadota bacterium]